MLAASAVLSVIGVILLWPDLSPNPSAADGPPTPAPTASASPSVRPTVPSDPKPAPSSASPTPSVASSPDGDALAGEVSDAALQRALEQSRRVSVPPNLEKRLVELGGKVLLADVTGEGRNAFPEYFRGQPATDRWRDSRIRAGVAERYKDRSDAVQVHLVWAGTSPEGIRDERQPTTVLLVRDQASGVWLPRPFSAGPE
ncbi:hypothetical protein OG735_24000 [Streptomyces sp. NBC_01210]|uniref:hypothetical protein n=1 Tax=Streptomyces sp. NBC_01210 TaxID=2903774 RepID=UPI002E0DF874|nr:hypothetical protein OG735_24000 [Streptomyces sp. NBC_01210]